MMRLVGRSIVNDSGPREVSLPPVPLTGDQAQNRFNTAVSEAIQSLPSHETVAVVAREAAAAAVTGAVDPRIPPQPSGLIATGAFRNILLEWDYPDYEYHGFSRVFRANVDDFSQAAVLANTEGRIWADNVGTAQVFFYWVANVSKAGVQSAINAVAGTRGETAPDVQFLLSTLQGQVLASTLAAGLQDRINLIDGNGAGSVNTRIATETTNRQNADGAIVQTHNQFVAQYGLDQAAISQTFTAQAGRLGTVEASYVLKLDVNGHVAGIGISTTATSSQMVILADRFAIIHPDSVTGGPVVPFIVQGGVVYISSAMIQDATITNAKIANLAVDNAKIAGGITADKLAVNSLSAVSGTIGLLRTATVGARTEIEDNQIRVYDGAGTLRVRMGVW